MELDYRPGAPVEHPQRGYLGIQAAYPMWSCQSRTGDAVGHRVGMAAVANDNP